MQDRDLVSECEDLQVQGRAGPDEVAKGGEQRHEDGRHPTRLSEHAPNLNRRNVYGILGSHSVTPYG